MDMIAVFGSSDHARVISDIIEKEGKYSLAGFVDRGDKTGEDVFGYKIIGKDEDLPVLITEYKLTGGIIAVGDNYKRYQISKKILDLIPGFQFVSAVHPAASIGKDVKIGQGTAVMAGAVVNPGCKIGNFCILNTNSSLDHDSIMDDFSSLGPNASAGGHVHVQEFSAIGIGANIIHGVSVGGHTVIGAGSTVMDNIGSNIIAYGTPAKFIRKRKVGEKYL